MKSYIVKHIDSNILISAFIPDEKDKDLQQECDNFLDHIKNKELNTKLRVSLPALGEVLMTYMKRMDAEVCGSEKDLGNLWRYFHEMRERLELYTPKLRGPPEKLPEVIERLVKGCEDIRGSDADALILAYAMIDPDAKSFYTHDTFLLHSRLVKNIIDDFRKDNNFRKLRIRPIPRSGKHSREDKSLRMGSG